MPPRDQRPATNALDRRNNIGADIKGRTPTRHTRTGRNHSHLCGVACTDTFTRTPRIQLRKQVDTQVPNHRQHRLVTLYAPPPQQYLATSSMCSTSVMGVIRSTIVLGKVVLVSTHCRRSALMSAAICNTTCLICREHQAANEPGASRSEITLHNFAVRHSKYLHLRHNQCPPSTKTISHFHNTQFQQSLHRPKQVIAANPCC